MTTARRSLPRGSQQWWVWFTAIFAITFVSFWPSFFSAIANVETLIVITAVPVVSEWWYGRSRWPFPALLAYFVIMLLTTDIVARAEWFKSLAISYANI
jgi:hypothetical protein